MVNKEYWNVSDAWKNRTVHSVPYVIPYLVVAYIIYLVDPEDIEFALIIVALGIGFVLREVESSRRIVSYPVCTFTDESVTFNCGRESLPWSMITRVVWHQEKRKVEIHYSTLPVPKYRTINQRGHSVSIDRRWMKDEEIFFNDLKAVCDERSIEFLVTEKEFGAR